MNAMNITDKTVRLSSIRKSTSLEVGRDLPSDVVCAIGCNYKGCRSSAITVMRNSTVYRAIKTNQSIFPRRQANVSDDGTYRCRLSDNTLSPEKFQLRILRESLSRCHSTI
jgi:hypothetical protein